jgi:hypothetical protein
MLLFSELHGKEKDSIVCAMQAVKIPPSQYDEVGQTIIQIICMEISGKTLRIEYKSIMGILNMAAVLVKVLEEMKNEVSTDAVFSGLYKRASAN